MFKKFMNNRITMWAAILFVTAIAFATCACATYLQFLIKQLSELSFKVKTDKGTFTCKTQFNNTKDNNEAYCKAFISIPPLV